MEKVYGKAVSGGQVMGKIMLLRRKKINEEDDVRSSEEEIERLKKAVAELERENEKLYENALSTIGESGASIFEVYKLMLDDDDFIGEALRIIKEDGVGAVFAVKKAGEQLSDMLSSMESEYMKQRAADVNALTDRLCAVLMGETSILELDERVIVASDDLSPAETVTLERGKVLGFVTEVGSEMSHTAILARIMGIPAVVSVGKIPEEWNGKTAVLNGKEGSLCIDPDERTVAAYSEEVILSEKEHERLEKLRGVRLKSRTGERIMISANAGAPEDIVEAVKNDAEGVGLFRSEFLFMRKSSPPTEDEQFEIYKNAAEQLHGEELVVRTLDVGADKRIPYLTSDVHEANPALGIRAVRLCLAMPSLLITQFRALLHAAYDCNISVMIPMISLPSEIDRVRDILDEAQRQLEGEGIAYGKLKLGIMIETPSAAILSDILAPMVDFFSIGTNDLIQYTVAADRENPKLEYLTKPMPESVRRCIKMTCEAGKRAGIPVCVCGELGADLTETEFFIKSGVTRLSVSPPKVLAVREKAAKVLNK